jgi:tetratricopeptide (TPR) repeat protein
MQRLAGAFPLVLLAIGLMQTPATADDRATCEKATSELALAACARAIASGEFSGLALAKLHNNRGVELKRTGDLDAAIKDYDIAINLNPDDLFAFNNRANAWRDKGNLDRAIADYGEAIRLDPDYAAAYVNRGLVHERRKQFDLARADFTAALAAPPKYNNSRGAHGMARERLGVLARISPN